MHPVKVLCWETSHKSATGEKFAIIIIIPKKKRIRLPVMTFRLRCVGTC